MAEDDGCVLSDFRELIRYERGWEVRVYQLRIATAGAELWRITESVDRETTAVKEADVKSIEDTLNLLEDIKRSLIAAGWREL